MNRLEQALSNLIGNAVEHGQPDTPVEIMLDGNTLERVGVRITNVGVIPDDALPNLFTPFPRRAAAAAAMGLGLGLYIVRQIVDAHEGEVEARCENGKNGVRSRAAARESRQEAGRELMQGCVATTVSSTRRVVLPLTQPSPPSKLGERAESLPLPRRPSGERVEARGRTIRVPHRAVDAKLSALTSRLEFIADLQVSQFRTLRAAR